MTSGFSRFTRPFVLCSAVAMLVGSGAVAHADGIPRGGSCCADLEERIAELEATTARKGNRKVSLTISGQVATSVMAWSDGNNNADASSSDTYVVDNTYSGGTFFDFSGNAKISPSLSAGFQITYAVCAGSRSGHVNQKDDDVPQPAGSCAPSSGDGSMVLTRANWYLDHKSIGRLTVGRQDTSTAGLTTIDLGGAGVAANASIGYWQGGMFLAFNDNLQAGTWNDALGGSTVAGASLSRGNFVKYSSPVVGGFSVQAAWGEDDVWDVALRYAGEFSGFRVAAGVGYINNNTGSNDQTNDHENGPERSQWKGSASVLHVASGLFLTGAYLDQDNDVAGRPNTTLWYAQGGISKNWTGLGKTVLYGEYARVDDPITGLDEEKFAAPNFFGHAITSSEATVWGLGIVQHIDAAAMEVFLSYRRYSAEADTAEHAVHEFNDIDVVMSGARIRF